MALTTAPTAEPTTELTAECTFDCCGSDAGAALGVAAALGAGAPTRLAMFTPIPRRTSHTSGTIFHGIGSPVPAIHNCASNRCIQVSEARQRE